MHRGLVGCPIVLQVVGQVWGGKRLASVSGVPCLSKEGWRGCWGGYGCWWKAGGICMGSLCAGVSCVSFLSIGC